MGSASPKAVTFSERVYRRLLRVYPAAYRSEYGPHMLQVFRDVCRDAYRQGRVQGLMRLWLRVLVDLGASASNEHYDEFRRSLMNKPSKNASISPRLGIALIVSIAAIVIGLLARELLISAGAPVEMAIAIAIAANAIAAVIMEFAVRSGGAILAAFGIVLASVLIPLTWVSDGVQWLRENPVSAGILLFAGLLIAQGRPRWIIFAIALFLAGANIVVSFI